MKRILAVFLTIIMLVTVTGCAIFPSVLLKIKPDKVNNMEIERLSDGMKASYAAEDKTIAKFISAVNSVLFYDDGETIDENDAVFRITMDSEEDDFDILVNDDGSLCLNGKHYAVDFSSKATLNLSKINRWVDDANRPEDEKDNPQESTPDEKDVTNESDPQEISDSIVKLSEKQDIVTSNGITYFIAEADILKENAVIFASTDNNGTINIYCKTPIGSSISYLNGSFEQSGGKILYAITDASGMGKEVYGINIETNKVIRVSASPSSNLIVFETPELSILGLGWMINGNKIIPVNLSTAAVDDTKVYDIRNDAVAKAINNSFFEKIREGYDEKTVELAAEDDNHLLITVTESSSEGNPELNYTFRFDCVNKTLEQI